MISNLANMFGMIPGFDVWRPRVIAITILVGFVALCFKLYNLQVVQGAEYSASARETTSYIITQYAPRGIIYDRTGKVLASNKQAPSLVVIPSITLKENFDRTIEVLSKILEAKREDLAQELWTFAKYGSKPTTWIKNLSIEQVVGIYENQFQLPGITVQEQPVRHYIYGPAFAHVLGYTGQIDESELAASPDRKLNDMLGKFGLEKTLDNTLRGRDSYRRIMVDRNLQPIEPLDLELLSSGNPSSGTDVVLTLDAVLQTVAYDSLDKLNGAVAMVEIPSGEILAMVSKPAFDPNIFSGKVSASMWKKLNSEKQFLNRAISAYTPGSIWKPLVLLAALDSGAVKPTEAFKVSGAIYMGKYRFGDWTSKTGSMLPAEALAWSRDTAFYQMAMRMTEPVISAWAHRLGFGRPTGIELEGESLGIVPDENWRKKHKMAWYAGSNLHYSIGQGYVSATPIQALRMIVGIATRGRLPELHLVKQIGNDLPRIYATDEKMSGSSEAWDTVHSGMIACVNSGTCGAAKLSGIQVAGKTGSAEAPPFKKTHGWFVAFAPAKEPRVGIVVFAEGAGHGGSVAAPIAKKMLEAYFGTKTSASQS